VYCFDSKTYSLIAAKTASLCSVSSETPDEPDHIEHFEHPVGCWGSCLCHDKLIRKYLTGCVLAGCTDMSQSVSCSTCNHFTESPRLEKTSKSTYHQYFPTKSYALVQLIHIFFIYYLKYPVTYCNCRIVADFLQRFKTVQPNRLTSLCLSRQGVKYSHSFF